MLKVDEDSQGKAFFDSGTFSWTVTDKKKSDCFWLWQEMLLDLTP